MNIRDILIESGAIVVDNKFTMSFMQLEIFMDKVLNPVGFIDDELNEFYFLPPSEVPVEDLIQSIGKPGVIVYERLT